MNLQKFQKNKKPVQFHFYKSGAGFVLLFAVTLAAILLAMALGVTNIALRELKFGTNARDTNDAFFAADSGAEYALFHDKARNICTPAPCSFNITISQLGNAGQSCVEVTVNKTALPALTTVISKGYNDGGNVPGVCTQGPNSVERELKVNY